MSVTSSINESYSSSSASSATSSTSLTGSNASDLQSSFLTLLVAQLKNQDPTNPMQNNELTTQLAQISTVSGIEKLNTTLGSISGQIDNSQSLAASALIGHGVMIPGSTILTGKDTTTPFGFVRRLTFHDIRYLHAAGDGAWRGINLENHLLCAIRLAIRPGRTVGVGKVTCRHVHAFGLRGHRGTGNVENI